MHYAIEFLKQRLGGRADSLQLPRTNTSPHADLTLSNETRRELERICADQFELWHNVKL